jgi:hypothetical protein
LYYKKTKTTKTTKGTIINYIYNNENKFETYEALVNRSGHIATSSDNVCRSPDITLIVSYIKKRIKK